MEIKIETSMKPLNSKRPSILFSIKQRQYLIIWFDVEDGGLGEVFIIVYMIQVALKKLIDIVFEPYYSISLIVILKDALI